MIGGTRWSMMPPVVKNLLIINGLLFLAANSFQVSMGIDLWDILGLHYFESSKFRIYQVVTYMFMHGDIGHIFFNMFAVWMFGSAIENAWGSKRFLTFYLLTGFGAAFVHYFIITLQLYPITSQLSEIIDQPSALAIVEFAKTHDWSGNLGPLYLSNEGIINQFLNGNIAGLEANPNDPVLMSDSLTFLRNYYNVLVDGPNVVGASGSLFGILLAFGMMFPNVPLFIMFIPFPIKAKYLVAGYGLFELISAIQNNPSDNVAHFAHLGGMLFGFIIIKYWQHSGKSWR